MTTAAVSDAPSTQPTDPHATKVAPDDPRLRIGHRHGRTLKKGPALALAFALFGVILLSLVFAFQAPPKPTVPSAEPGAPPPRAPEAAMLPDAIRNAGQDPPRVMGEAAADPFVATRRDGGLPPAFVNRASGDTYSPDRLRRDRIEQYWRARNSSILFDSARGIQNDAPASRAPASNDGTSRSDGRASAPPSSDDPNLQDRKSAFLEKAASTREDYITSTRQEPRSPYEIKAGTIIPAVLITAINSDLPGPVIAQVRENVYDTVSGNYLLVPQGARLLATYDSMVAWGQERVLVCWNRLIFPDGSSVHLPCMPASDLEGAAGLTDDVNEHWGRIIKGVAVASLLAATTQSVAGNTEGFNPTLPQTWARGTAGEINNAGQQITRRNINVQPTITVRPGFSVNVIVTKDIIVPPFGGGASVNAARGGLPGR